MALTPEQEIYNLEQKLLLNGSVLDRNGHLLTLDTCLDQVDFSLVPRLYGKPDDKARSQASRLEGILYSKQYSITSGNTTLRELVETKPTLLTQSLARGYGDTTRIMFCTIYNLAVSQTTNTSLHKIRLSNGRIITLDSSIPEQSNLLKQLNEIAQTQEGAKGSSRELKKLNEK